MPGLTEKIKQRIHEARETRKQEKKEHTEEHKKLVTAEREARSKERIHQAEERGKHSAQREYGNQGGSGTRRPKSKPSYRSHVARTPMFEPVNDPLMGMFGARRPKPKTPTKTTTVRTGNKTITIREKQEANEEQKKKRRGPEYDFYDPLSFENF